MTQLFSKPLFSKLLFSKLRAGLAATLLVLGMASAASAVTVNLNTLQSGQNVGHTTLATLTATQVGADVQFVLTNTANIVADNFISLLELTYDGALANAGFQNISGKAASSFSTGSFTDASLNFQFRIEWPVSNKNNGASRLNFGDSSTFKITNTTLAGFFLNTQGNKFAMVHLQGLNNIAGQDSTKYTNDTNTVPLPAGAPLLLAGLGALAALRRKRKAATAV